MGRLLVGCLCTLRRSSEHKRAGRSSQRPRRPRHISTVAVWKLCFTYYFTIFFDLSLKQPELGSIHLQAKTWIQAKSFIPRTFQWPGIMAWQKQAKNFVLFFRPLFEDIFQDIFPGHNFRTFSEIMSYFQKNVLKKCLWKCSGVLEECPRNIRPKVLVWNEVLACRWIDP